MFMNLMTFLEKRSKYRYTILCTGWSRI